MTAIIACIFGVLWFTSTNEYNNKDIWMEDQQTMMNTRHGLENTYLVVPRGAIFECKTRSCLNLADLSVMSKASFKCVPIKEL